MRFLDGGGFGRNRTASNVDETGAKLGGDFEKNKTPPQIEEANKLARECVRKKYKGC